MEALETENARLEKLVAEQALGSKILREEASRIFRAWRNVGRRQPCLAPPNSPDGEFEA